MEAADPRAALTCSLCQDIYTDPVSLGCGHNFCRLCIDYVLDVYVAYEEHFCPQCKKKFKAFPQLVPNKEILAEIESYRAVQSGKDTKNEVTVKCLYCVDSPRPAVKTCVQCETSLCEQHLRCHNERLNHVLIPPTTTAALAYRKCSQHSKQLQYYCSQDAACVCASCCTTGSHQGHHVMSVKDAFDIEKKKLDNFLYKLKLREKKINRRIQRLAEVTSEAREKTDTLRIKMNGIFSETIKKLSLLQKATKDALYDDLKKISRPELTRRLHKQRRALSGRIRRVWELRAVLDPVALLQKVESDKDLRHDAPDEDMEPNNEPIPSISRLNEETMTASLLFHLSHLVEEVHELHGASIFLDEP